jgi:predicted DNA-binding mobile mystery protein A
MTPAQRAARARRDIDRRFAGFDIAPLRATPRSGWIKAIRTALGMSQRDLAARLRVTTSAVHRLERRELDGRISLAKLTEVAAALDCTVIYAFLPNSSLEETVQDQAQRVAAARLRYVAGTMSLEGQAVAPHRRAGHAEAYAQELIAANDLWRDDQAAGIQAAADETGA